MKQSVFHAIRAGEALLQAKSLCMHGMWLPWLKQNFKGSHRTANFYMQLARDYGGDPQRVADLSLREAVQALREADRAGDTVEPRDGRDRQAREASRRKHGGWVGGADLARLDSLLRDARTVARAALTIFDVAEDAVRMAEPARRALRKHGAKTVNDLPAEVQAKVPQFGDLIFYDWGELAARMEEALKLMETALKLVRPVTVTITKGTRRGRSSGGLQRDNQRDSGLSLVQQLWLLEQEARTLENPNP